MILGAYLGSITVIQHSLMKLIAPMGGENFAIHFNSVFFIYQDWTRE